MEVSEKETFEGMTVRNQILKTVCGNNTVAECQPFPKEFKLPGLSSTVTQQSLRPTLLGEGIGAACLMG